MLNLLAGKAGAFAVRPPYAKLLLGTAPVAWWPLDTSLADLIGGRDGAIGAGSQVHAGPLPADRGRSFDCAGSNWISVDHAAVLKPAVGSVMAWFKPASVHDGIIVSANAPGFANDDFALRVNADGTVSCFFQQGGGSQLIQTAAPYYGAGQVVQAMVTFDSGGFTLYLDGNRIAANGNHTSGLASNTLAWRFGEQEDSSAVFDGQIDEIAIWSRVLTRNEIYLLAQTEPN